MFQVSIINPENAVQLAEQMQETLGHRVVSWQEREKVWLEVFKALRVSSAITVSTILLLSGLGMFNVFAIMVIEKNRDIAILRSMGFSPRDISSHLSLARSSTVLPASFWAARGFSPPSGKFTGIFSTDSFRGELGHCPLCWAIGISTVFVGVASWIPARRASSNPQKSLGI